PAGGAVYQAPAAELASISGMAGMIEGAKREPRNERQPLCRCHAQGVTETAQRETLLTAERASFAMDDRFAYFNTAAISPLLHVVRKAANRALDQRSKPWTMTSASWFDGV